MAFLMGMGGFIVTLAAYLIGFWRGRTAPREQRQTQSSAIPVMDEKRKQEWYNFLHFDGSRMPVVPKAND